MIQIDKPLNVGQMLKHSGQLAYRTWGEAMLLLLIVVFPVMIVSHFCAKIVAADAFALFKLTGSTPAKAQWELLGHLFSSPSSFLIPSAVLLNSFSFTFCLVMLLLLARDRFGGIESTLRQAMQKTLDRRFLLILVLILLDVIFDNIGVVIAANRMQVYALGGSANFGYLLLMLLGVFGGGILTWFLLSQLIFAVVPVACEGASLRAAFRSSWLLTERSRGTMMGLMFLGWLIMSCPIGILYVLLAMIHTMDPFNWTASFGTSIEMMMRVSNITPWMQAFFSIDPAKPLFTTILSFASAYALVLWIMVMYEHLIGSKKAVPRILTPVLPPIEASESTA